MLQMHDQIAFLQIGEINVERGTRGQRVRGFLAARPLDFVAAENFRVGDDDEFRLVANKAASERAEVSPKSDVEVQGLLAPSASDFDLTAGLSKPSSFQISSNRWRSPSLLQKTWTA